MSLALLDTNILLYAFDRHSPQKRAVAEELLASEDCVISSQVAQEFVHVAGRKWKDAFSPKAIDVIWESILRPKCVVYTSEHLFEQALQISMQTQYTFYDALIVAAAVEARCAVLYSEDLQHGREIAGVEIRNPFADPKTYLHYRGATRT